MQCSVAGVKPKIQVWGGDVKATGNIETSVTDITQGQNRRHGSWGEYGVFSNGTNALMASGAGLSSMLANRPQQQWSGLTFGNVGTFGNFNSDDLAHAPVSDEGATTYANLTVDSLDDLLPAGRTHAKVVVNGTLTINGNLEYRSTASTISQLQKVVIHARNIQIHEDVTRIDPWLVAENISTCRQISAGGFRPMTTASLLRAGVCGNRLKFNGPVIADRIYLYRTYDDVNGNPAETFNLRADNFLSSYTGSAGISKPVATTSSVTELPPRF